MKKLLGIILGALLVVGGVVGILDTFGITQMNVSFDGWWTLFIIIPSVFGLATSKDKIGNLLFLALGVYLLLAARDVIEYDMFWQLIVPTVIVLLGIKMISKTIRCSNDLNKDEKDGKECMALFSEKNEDFSGKNIDSIKIGAVFGGTKCNLIGANFDEKSRIDIFCLFGGIDFFVPENVDIKMNTFCLFGGMSDKRNADKAMKKTEKLTINGFCMFGGADIK